MNINQSAIDLKDELLNLLFPSTDFMVGVRESAQEIVVYLPKLSKKVKTKIPGEWDGFKVIIKQASKPQPAHD